MVKIPRGTHERCDASQLLSQLNFDPSLPCWYGSTVGLWNRLDGKTDAGMYQMDYIGFPVDSEPPSDKTYPVIEANLDDQEKTCLRIIWIAVAPHHAPYFRQTGARMRVEGRFPASSDPVIGRPVISIVNIGDVSKDDDWNRVMNDARLAYSVVHGVVTSRRGASTRDERYGEVWRHMVQRGEDLKRKNPRLTDPQIAANLGLTEWQYRDWKKASKAERK